MIWKNIKNEIPTPGRVVTVINAHWKHEGYQSITLFTGEVWLNNKNNWYVCNNDFLGQGCQCWYPYGYEKFMNNDDNSFEFWAYEEEMPELPTEYKPTQSK